MEALVQFLPLIILIVLMYFLMIRPQKKKDKAIQDMRSSLSVGDEIVTIGGICGKIVKVKDESIIISVGAEKVKFEMMKWSVSTVTKESSRKVRENIENQNVEEESTQKKMPKRLKKTSDVEELEKAAEPAVTENVEAAAEEVETVVEQVVENTEEPVVEEQ